MSSSESPTPPLVLGFVSVGHSCRAIARTALAYSNLRRFRWPLAYLDLPLLFVYFGCVHTHRLETFTSLGKASAHLDRAGNSGTTPAPRRARWLLWFIVAVHGVVVFSVIPTVIRNRWGGGVLDPFGIYYAVLFGLPFITYVLPAIVQMRRAGKTDEWEAETSCSYDGRQVVKADTLGSWPIKGGGRTKSSGHGLKLVKALAADARSRGQIKIGVARDLELAQIYVDETGAERSAANPLHLRWP